MKFGLHKPLNENDENLTINITEFTSVEDRVVDLGETGRANKLKIMNSINYRLANETMNEILKGEFASAKIIDTQEFGSIKMIELLVEVEDEFGSFEMPVGLEIRMDANGDAKDISILNHSVPVTVIKDIMDFLNSIS